MHADARYCLLTSRQTAAIATVLLSGSHVLPFLKKHCRTATQAKFDEPGSFFVCTLRENERILDDVIVAALPATPSTWEIHCHGGAAVVDTVIALLEKNGFTQAATPDGFSLLQSETVNTLSSTPSFTAATTALAQAGGVMQHWIQRITSLAQSSPDGLAEAINKCDIVLRRSNALKPLFTPARVVLAGRPNSGKSSLFNALAGKQHVIVSDIPGTTLDTVECLLLTSDIPFVLVDTAGLHAGNDAVEQEAMQRSRAAASRADVLIEVCDASDAASFAQILPDHDRPRLRVWNKIDLPRQHTPASGDLAVSAKTGHGLEQLRETIARLLIPDPPRAGEAVFFTDRQRTLLAEALGLLRRTDASSAVQAFDKLIGQQP